MSIVIPAGHLERTVITIRYDAPDTAPHIECAALDEQHVYAYSPHEFRPSHPSSSNTWPTPSSSAATPELTSKTQAALNIERGMDYRGHFVRLSFQQASPCTSHVYGQRPSDHEMPETSFFPQSQNQERSPLNLSFAQEASSFCIPGIGLPQVMNNGSGLEYSSASIINNMHTVPSETNPTCIDVMNFGRPSDLDLMSALGSFMGDFDMPHNMEYSMLNMGVTGSMPSSQSLDQILDPASPEMSSTSSSSSSSCTNSPRTPYDFLPTSTPTTDDGCKNSEGDTIDGCYTQPISDSSLQSSPVLPQLTPGPKQKVGASRKSQLLPCPQPGCKRQFKKASTLDGHLKTHAGKGSRFPCSFPPCAEKFSRRHDQLRHEVYKHGKRCEWVCARCNSFFSYARSLEKHICTADKSRKGSIPYPTTLTSKFGDTPGVAR